MGNSLYFSILSWGLILPSDPSTPMELRRYVRDPTLDFRRAVLSVAVAFWFGYPCR